jgi:ADP-ribosylglycohydrolase
MNRKEKIKGSLILGAIGDCVGGSYEGMTSIDYIDFNTDWSISDDTQLTLATAEAIINKNRIDPESIAKSFLDWYNKGMLSGLGASTLKALRELQVGGHWALVGRQGEFAAGNGAAMRIAPLAYIKNIDRIVIRDVCRITHKNDEAYCGALMVFYAIHYGLWENKKIHDLFKNIIHEIPDTRVKDRLIELSENQDRSIVEIGKKFKATGYVVDSVPLAIFAAKKANNQSIESIFTEIIKKGTVVVIDDVEEKDIGSIGSFNILYWKSLGAVGVVTDASSRDTDEIAIQKVPLYLRKKGLDLFALE